MTRSTLCICILAAALLASACRSDSRAQSPVLWRASIEVAVGSADAGPWRMNESEFRYVDDPTVALAEDGRLFVAWVDNERKDVFIQSYDSAGKPKLGAPINVSRSPAIFSWLPRLEVTAEQVFVLWQEIVFSGGTHGGEIFFARSLDGGRTFGAALNLSRSAGGDGKGRLTAEHWDNGSLDLARAQDGTLLAAWTEYGGALWFCRSTDQGQSFSAPIHVAGDSDRPARAPALAVGRDGAVFLAWTLGEDPAADIQLAVSRDGGRTFPAPRIIAKTEGHSDAPQIAVDEHGALHVVWSENKRVWYGRSRDANAPFESSVRGTGASFPSLSVTDGGNVYIAWHHHPGGDDDRIGLGFVMSRDGGRTFASPSLAARGANRSLGVNGSRQGKLMRLLDANDAGTVALVNSRFRAGEESRIELFIGQTKTQRLSSRR